MNTIDCNDKKPCIDCRPDNTPLAPVQCGDNPCPEPNPCSKITRAECVIYTGDDIVCDEEVVVEQGSTIGEAMSSLTQFVCEKTSQLLPAVAVTYSQLYNLIITETLVPGQVYRLTDYKSVNYVHGVDIADDNSFEGATTTYVSEEEVLVLKAMTESLLEPICYSEKYPGDIITYEAFTNKIGVPIGFQNGNTLPNSQVLSDFNLKWNGTNVYFELPDDYPALFGHYFYIYAEFYDGANYYRQDGLFEPLMPGIVLPQYPYSSDEDFVNYPKKMSRIRVENNGLRIVLLDLTQTDFYNYSSNTLFVESVRATDNAYGWIVKREDTQKNITAPFDFRNRRYRRYEVDFEESNIPLGRNYYLTQPEQYIDGNLYTTTGEIALFKVFGNEGDEASNILWEGPGGPDTYYERGFNDNNVFLNDFKNIHFRGQIMYNTCIDGFEQNTAHVDMFYNIFDEDFDGNVILKGIFAYNIFSYSCYDNTLNGYMWGNIIGNNFAGNTFKDGAGFGSCKIGSNTQYNAFNRNLNSVILPNNFRNNEIKTELYNEDLSSATLVTNDYEKTIFRNADGDSRLRYFNSSDVLTIALITD